ncbi:hypothetical protein ES702_04703 [subsurface metagenome]
MNEREAEIPWFLSKLKKGSVLDGGSLESTYIKNLLERGHKVIRNDTRAFSCPFGTKVVIKDIFKLKSETLGKFDNVLLVSTLEHIGLKAYKNKASKNPLRKQNEALRHCFQFLKKGGKLLCTLPYGKFENGGWYFIYDEKMVNSLINGLNLKSKTYFTLSKEKKNYRECLQEEVPLVGWDKYHCRSVSVVCLEFMG